MSKEYDAQEHHNASPCYDKDCEFEHPFGGPFPHPCDPEPIECCASGKCEVCAPGGFGGSKYW